MYSTALANMLDVMSGHYTSSLAEEAHVDDINLLKEAAQAKPRDGLKLAFHPKDTRGSVEIQHAAFA